MGKLVVSEFLTVDGTMEDPGGAEGSQFGGWAFKVNRGQEADRFKQDELLAADALLLGRKTYDGFSQAWPHAPEDEAGYTKRMNTIPKYVVSPDEASEPWTNSQFITHEPIAEIKKLKEQKNLLVFGSGMIVHSLLEAGLVDEIRMMIWPTIAGGGKHLFDGLKLDLDLVKTIAYGSGVIVLVYKPKNA